MRRLTCRIYSCELLLSSPPRLQYLGGAAVKSTLPPEEEPKPRDAGGWEEEETRDEEEDATATQPGAVQRIDLQQAMTAAPSAMPRRRLCFPARRPGQVQEPKPQAAVPESLTVACSSPAATSIATEQAKPSAAIGSIADKGKRKPSGPHPIVAPEPSRPAHKKKAIGQSAVRQRWKGHISGCGFKVPPDVVLLVGCPIRRQNLPWKSPKLFRPPLNASNSLPLPAHQPKL